MTVCGTLIKKLFVLKSDGRGGKWAGLTNWELSTSFCICLLLLFVITLDTFCHLSVFESEEREVPPLFLCNLFVINDL